MKKNVIFVICSIVFCLFFLPFAFQLPDSSEVSTMVGPKAWPLTLLLLGLLLSIIMVVQLYLQKNKEPEVDEEEERMEEFSSKEDTEEAESFLSKYRHWILLTLTLAYVIVMGITGFVIATGIFIFICTFILGMKSIKQSILTTVFGTLLVFVFFDTLLSIPLP